MMRVAVLVQLGAAALVAVPASVQAQAYAQPVVQALPDPAAMRLSEALRALGQDPRSVSALIEAGHASLGLDDVEAAAGFFARAAAISPDDGAVKAGLASVATRQGRPIEALALFAQAEAAGEPMRIHAAERGLAFDLVGDNAQAQEQYAISLSVAPDPEVVRRLALSQAIAGDQRASEATLLPLLQRRDLAAYRTRAFALAVLDKTDEAVAIAETMLPERISSRIAPYLRYMPRLTRAQPAAAANLGVFPRAAEIGRDDPAIAAYSGPPSAAPAPQRGAGSRLVPAGEPLGERGPATGSIRRRPVPVQVPTAAVAQENPPLVVPPQPPQREPVAPAPVVVAAMTAEVAQAVPTASNPQPVPAEPQPEVDLSLAEAFADFSLPRADAGPAAGAVDITQIQPRREAPPRPAPAPPAHPSRQWVQVATGRDVKALEFDWRRLKRNAGGLLDRYKPHVAAWGQTNRLVAGPFSSAREAQEFVAKLKEKQVDSFRFTSAQGEEVRPLE